MSKEELTLKEAENIVDNMYQNRWKECGVEDGNTIHMDNLEKLHYSKLERASILLLRTEIRLKRENQKYKEVIDNLRDKLMEYFEVGRDCYFYVLTRDKSAFNYGTMSFDDFKEFSEEQIDDIIDFLKEVE